MGVCQSKVRIPVSLTEIESQNAKWKTENNGRRETATRLLRDCGEDEYKEAESVLPVRSGTISHLNRVQLYLSLVLLGFVTVVYRLFVFFLHVCMDDYIIVPN